MTDGNLDGVIDVLIKRKSTKNHGFDIERREEDGFYYITKVPRNCTEIGVGDRVLEINGTIFEDFQDEKDANDLIDCTLLEVIPDGDAHDGGNYDEEEYEVMNRSRQKKHNVPTNGSSRSNNRESQNEFNEDHGGYGEDWNHSDETKREDPDWDNGELDNSHSKGELDNSHSNSNYSNSSFVKQDKKSWDRDYVSQYKANDRFMISVTKREEDDDFGIDIVEFQEGEIYVSRVHQGPFYDTALARGDRIISINGKKIPDNLTTAEEAVDILHSHEKITLFALRPRKSDRGYKWVKKNT